LEKNLDLAREVENFGENSVYDKKFSELDLQIMT
jgi:hypothetical protein